jgi:hypothetical protein
MNLNPAPAPEGVLDPQQPWWPTANMRDSSWEILKAKLTGRRMPDGTQYETWVRLSDGDADRLIANIKKYGKYPQVNLKDRYGGYENLPAYQKWLVEEFLEKPFRDETNKKIEDAQQEARIEELRKEAEKNKQKVIIKNKEVPLADVYKQAEEGNENNDQVDEEKELDKDQEALEKEIDKITIGLDSVDESTKSEQSEQNSEEDKKDNDTINSDFDKIKTSLEGIQGSLSIQASDLNQININTSDSIGSLSGIKNLLKIRTDILKKKLEDAKNKLKEASLEKDAGQVLSGNAESVSTTASMEAEGVVQQVTGKTVTVAPTKGVFVKGQKITQGGGGGGLSDLFGQIGKLFGGGGGEGEGASAAIGALTKLSGGGFLNTSYPAYAEGTISPGVYDKPTRGQLAPGQAVVPLNRNVGKKLLGGNPLDQQRLRKYDQPLVDVMSQPLKAIGLSIISVAGNFIKSLGPLGGFFLPYAKGLVKGFAAVLGVPVTLIMSLLGGPAYAAVEQQDKQQNIFAKLWDNLMKTFGFNFGGEEDKKENKKETTPGNPNFKGSEGGEKTMNFLMSQGLTPQQAAGVAGNLMQESHFDPNADNGTHHGIAQWDKQNRWPKVSAYITSIGRDPNTLEGQLMGLKWEADQRHDWKQIQQTKTAQDAALKWLERFEISGEKPGMPGFDNRMANANGLLAKYGKVSAESGVQIKVKDDQSMGKMLGWSVVKGPNAGYDVNSNLEMHGEEAYLQYEKGFTILPIENNKYSLSENPMATLDRWKEILGPNNTVNVNGEYETGGKQVFDPKKYSGNARSSRYIPIGQGNNAKSYVVMYERQGASGTVIVKAISKRVSGDDLIGVSPSSKEWNQVLNSENTKEELFFDIAQSLKKELKTDKDAGTYYAYNQAFQTTKNAWLKKGFSQKDAETYAAAAAKEFALTRNSGSWLPGSRNGLDPSLKDVEVSSGDTSSSSSSGEPDNDFQLMEKAFSAMIVGAGIMASDPKNKDEYDRLKAQLESAFKVTTPTTSTVDSNAPAPQQTTTAHASPTPTITPSHPTSAVTTSETLTQPTMQEQLCQWSAIYYA